jgi:hypothetical protein
LKSPEIINSSVKMFRKTEDLVDFDAKDLEKFKERMNQLIAIENKMVSNTGSVVGGELDKFDILGSNNRNIKEVLEDLGDQKNQVFEKYKEYELYVKQYYKLLREASKLRKRNYLSDPAYEEAILKASELNNRIISFREIELAHLEENYNRKLLHWRKILIIDNDNIHGAVTSGNGDKEKLKSNAKPFIKFIVEKLGGEDKLVDMLYTKKEGKMGSSLYLSSKIQIDLGDGVYAEIAALPTWLMTLGELVAPHEGYSKQKIDNIKAPLGRILKKLSNK